jgi:hypothetical protein
MAYDDLKEAVANMRLIRGCNCYPVVELTERPWPTRYGLRQKPFLNIIGWKTLGDDRVPVEGPQPLQLPPATGTATLEPAPASTPTPPPPPPMSTPPAPKQPRQPKRPVNLSDYTLAMMGDIPKPTTEEVLNDSLDDLPWDAKPKPAA